MCVFVGAVAHGHEVLQGGIWNEDGEKRQTKRENWVGFSSSFPYRDVHRDQEIQGIFIY